MKSSLCNTMKKVFLLLSLTTSLSSVFTLPAAANTVRSENVQIQFFNASTYSIDAVQPVRLWWKVLNAVQVDVYDGFRNTTYTALGNENYIEVWPEKTSQYTLYAYSSTGQVFTQTITIEFVVKQPQISYFYSSASIVHPGDPIRLLWDVKNATRLVVFDGSNNVNIPVAPQEGFVDVWPNRSANFILFAYGSDDQVVSVQLSVRVVPKGVCPLPQ
ncbi:MAG: hypothetical protein ACOH5I_20780 [Oligoflexus sp.]